MKVKQKATKEQKAALIALLLGDGTICSNNVFKLCHAQEQQEYLNWKINILNELGIKNSGLKTYISTCGYNIGKKVIYTQLSIIPIIKVLRRVVYKPNKTFTKKLLNWIDDRGLAIWYMDDGHLNVNSSSKRSSIQHVVHLTTCVDKYTADMMKVYFKEKWNIKMRVWEERPNKFSLATSGEQETIKFLNIVKPYIEQVPSMLYKLRNNYTKEEFIQRQLSGLKCETLV